MNRLPLLSVIQVLFGFALESQNYPAQILTSLRARLGQLSAAPAPPANHCSELVSTVSHCSINRKRLRLLLAVSCVRGSRAELGFSGFLRLQTVPNSSEQ